MTQPTLFHRITFHCFLLLPFAAGLLMLAFLFGCQPKKAPPKEQLPTVTLENLQTAYNKEMNYQYMYSKFVAEAKKEKNKEMTNLFQAIVLSEQVHAQQHADLMRSKGVEPKAVSYDSISVGTIVQTLKMAVSCEEIETSSMYPNMIRTADAEKFPAAVEQMTQCKDGDARQAELLKDAQDHSGKIKKAQYYVCPKCGYIFNSEETSECPSCKTTKDKFSKI